MSVIIPGMNLEHERVEFRPRTVRSSLCCVTDLVVCLSAGILLCISVMCCVLCVGLIISRLHYVNVFHLQHDSKIFSQTVLSLM